MEDGDEQFSGSIDDNFITAVVFSPDGAALLVSSGFGSPSIHRWDVATGEPVNTLEGHRSYVTDLQFTPDGNHLISSSTDQTIRLWDWPEGRATTVLRGHADEIDGLAVPRAGNTVASRCRDGSIFMWPLIHSAQTPTYRMLPVNVATRFGIIYGQPRPAVFTPDNRSIIVIESNNELSQWDIATLRETRRWQSETQTAGRVVLAPDGSQAAMIDTHGRLSLMDLRTGVERKDVLPDAPVIDTVWFSGNNQYMVTGNPTESKTAFEIRIWDLPHCELKGMDQVQMGGISFGNTHQATYWVLGQNGCAHIWDLSRPQTPPRQLLPDERGKNLLGFDISPDGRVAVGAFGTGYIRVWDLDTGEQLQMMRVFLRSPLSVTFSPDGRRLAAGGIGREAVKMWSTADWHEVATLSGEGAMFRFVAFSPDGQTLMARNSQGLLHIWSTPSLEDIETTDADATSNLVTSIHTR
jgi:WD40 repeat protein